MRHLAILLLAGLGSCGRQQGVETCARLFGEVGMLAITAVESSPDHCLLRAEAPTEEVLSGPDPVSAARAWFRSRDDEELLSRAADGPGTTRFVFAGPQEECQVVAGAPTYLDGGELVVDERYTLELRCVRTSRP